jgi:GDPmannose 4,6-dehydratase
MPKTALITGITGQDGALLAEWLLGQGYRVHGIKRRSSQFNTSRVDHLYQDPHEPDARLRLHHGDLSDGASLLRIMQQVQPDEVYNLGAMSHVAVSFEQPEYTANVDGLGTLRLLEAIHTLGLRQTRFYQASTSEMFGRVATVPQHEATPFHPRSPYGVAKLFAHWTTVNYREAYGLFACNGILFNHESPLRGETFVTRKVTRGLARIVLGLQHTLHLGNLDALRDWGHARDYVRAMWLMLQQPQPQDLVIASGVQHSVREFVRRAAAVLGLALEFRGHGTDEVGIVAAAQPLADGTLPACRPGAVIVRVDPRYFRPAEVDTLLGDATRARQLLGWSPTIGFDDLVHEMVQADLLTARRDSLLHHAGLGVASARD